jgi:hyperosmotically inducible periplasmic protein
MKKISTFSLVLLLCTVIYSCKPSDEKIGEAINKSLAANTSLSHLTTAIKDGIVTISGEVETDELKTLAESTLKGIKGVSSVVNSVTVKPKGPSAEELAKMADDALLSKVNEAFATYKVTGIVASVKAGVVSLTGDVKRSELQNVMKAAMETGAVKVENLMTIK